METVYFDPNIFEKQIQQKQVMVGTKKHIEPLLAKAIVYSSNTDANEPALFMKIDDKARLIAFISNNKFYDTSYKQDKSNPVLFKVYPCQNESTVDGQDQVLFDFVLNDEAYELVEQFIDKYSDMFVTQFFQQ